MHCSSPLFRKMQEWSNAFVQQERLFSVSYPLHSTCFRLNSISCILFRIGKANLSEWAHFRGNIASGWSGRGGQCTNAYFPDADPCGSSSGSGVAASIGLAAVTLGTETDGSITCPTSNNNLAGIKPSVGLTSRAGGESN